MECVIESGLTFIGPGKLRPVLKRGWRCLQRGEHVDSQVILLAVICLSGSLYEYDRANTRTVFDSCWLIALDFTTSDRTYSLQNITIAIPLLDSQHCKVVIIWAHKGIHKTIIIFFIYLSGEAIVSLCRISHYHFLDPGTLQSQNK